MATAGDYRLTITDMYNVLEKLRRGDANGPRRSGVASSAGSAPNLTTPPAPPPRRAALELPAAAAPAAKQGGKAAWPKQLSDQLRQVRTALEQSAAPATPGEVARSSAGAKADSVAELLDALAAMGQARRTDGGRYAA